MPRGARGRINSGIYHVILRELMGKEIFHDNEDCYRFLFTINYRKMFT